MWQALKGHTRARITQKNQSISTNLINITPYNSYSIITIVTFVIIIIIINI